MIQRIALATTLLVLCSMISAVAPARPPRCKQPAEPVQVSSIPPEVILHRPGEEKSGWLLIAADDNDSWADLVLSAGPLALGNNHAFMRFAAAPEEASLNLGDARAGCQPKQDCRIQYIVHGVTAHGTYSGTFDLTGACGSVGTATVKVLLDAPVFQPALSGESLKNGQVDADVTNARMFSIVVAAPDTDPDRTYGVTGSATRVERPGLLPVSSGTCMQLDPSGASSLQFSPSQFELDGGQSRTIEVRVPDCLATGTYEGVIRVADTSNPALQKDWSLTVHKALPAEERRLGMLAWVVLGAFVSVLINNIFPISRARQDRFDQLREIHKSLKGFNSIGPGLMTALVSDTRRLWLLIDGISIFNPRKDTALTSATQALQDLAKRVELAGKINRQYTDANLGELPIRIGLTINQQLRDAEDALADNDVSSAAAHLDSASQLIRVEPALASLIADLKKDIGKLLTDHPDDDVPTDRPLEIQNRIEQLGEDAKVLDTMSLREVLAVERDFYIADVWTDVVEFAEDLNHLNLDPIRGPLLRNLIAAPTSAVTQRIVALIQAGISPLDLEEALEQSTVHIECDEKPRYLDLVDFSFVLTRPALRSVPATSGLLEYQWRFDDNTTSPDAGASCKHFFLPPSRAKWSWIWLSWLFKTGPQEHVRKVTVTVRVPEWGKSREFARELTLQPRDGSAGVTAMQAATFFITTAMAVLAAFGAQYSGVLPIAVDWSAGVTAFMFGFGIDQLRDRTTNA